MIHVPHAALPHLASAVTAEIERLQAIDDLPEEQWPQDFNGTDIEIYKRILKSIHQTVEDRAEFLDFGTSKFSWFLTMSIPRYVAAKRNELSWQEVELLRGVYDQWPRPEQPFPDVV